MALEDILVVLVEPAHPGNVGAVARAMKTMALRRLVLVRPKDFPSLEAERRAIHGVDIIERAQVVDTLDEAIGDCRLVIGCSARERKFPHPILDARECAAKLVKETSAGEPAALLFGPERMGLSNHDLDRCSYQLRIPTEPKSSSLNLAAAVQLVCYEIFLASHQPEPHEPVEPPGTQREMEHFYLHLERALDSRGFLDGEMREVTMMKMRRLFGRARPTSGEIKLLRTIARFMHRDGD